MSTWKSPVMAMKSVAFKMDTNTRVKPICSILHLSEEERNKRYPRAKLTHRGPVKRKRCNQ